MDTLGKGSRWIVEVTIPAQVLRIPVNMHGWHFSHDFDNIAINEVEIKLAQIPNLQATTAVVERNPLP